MISITILFQGSTTDVEPPYQLMEADAAVTNKTFFKVKNLHENVLWVDNEINDKSHVGDAGNFNF